MVEKHYLINNEKLIKEWNWDKNNELGLNPNLLTCGTHKKGWWLCQKCGYEWQAEIKSRVNGNGCPKCGKLKAAKTKSTPHNGESLDVLFPDLMKEWDYEKNISIEPSACNIGSPRKVYWKCQYGHSWLAQINKRTLRHQGCPHCYATTKTSFPEQAILFYLSKLFNVKNREKINGFEFDIFLTDYNIAIEYDGVYWHNKSFAKNMETRKNLFCEQNNIVLLRVKELLDKDKTAFCEDKTIFYRYTSENLYLDNAIKLLIATISNVLNYELNIDINVLNDRNLIRLNYEQVNRENSLLLFPKLTEEWDFDKNNGLQPQNVSPGSEIKVWWICKKGHSYCARISHRVNGSGCPYCNNKKVIPGENDLLTKNPILAQEWNYEKNEGLKPNEVAPSSNKIVWWICKKGHSYHSSIAHRASGTGCPYCANRKIIPGQNDLLTKNPLLAEDWDYEKNDGLKPSEVAPSSGIIVWWKCKSNHHWQASIDNRHRGKGCPYCANQKIISGQNDLLTKNPLLAEDWDYEKNSPLLPSQFSSGSGKNVWWRCKKCGYEWQAKIYDRATRKFGCPNCRKNKIKK